jgi:hypothetical protein
VTCLRDTQHRAESVHARGTGTASTQPAAENTVGTSVAGFAVLQAVYTHIEGYERGLSVKIAFELPW